MSRTTEWTLIAKRPPELTPDAEGFPVSEDVLIYCGKDQFVGIAHAAIYDEKIEWFSRDDWNVNDATHWMSLPPKPGNLSVMNLLGGVGA